MSSIAHTITDEASREHGDIGLAEFSRLERMLLFAVITECERCIESEGGDCLDTNRNVSCPFVDIRKEHGILNMHEWKGMVQ